MVFEKVVAGQPPLIFGADYHTPDGTCVRDLVHVSDLADAHLRVLKLLRGVHPSSHEVFNVGTGEGYSVREVIAAVARATGQTMNPAVVARRPGDPASVVANPRRLRASTGWAARRGLDEMVESAWAGCQYGRRR